ncbi:MAG: UDP-N-acetylmuramate dehydrogenase [Candidatus Omnitrophota bacterium]|nr:UDP-N-acetylmuramate dehydrogenase [Candidatus Omnitrophota bacterium]
MNWQERLKGRVRLKEALKSHTTFKIGGPAEFFIEPKDIQDLKNIILNAGKIKIPIFLIGAGSNILVSDKGVSGVVLRLSGVNFKKLLIKGDNVWLGAGLLIRQFLSKTIKHGLSGAEFLAGIPGTIGGALIMNAGAYGRTIGDLIEEVSVMDYNGNIKAFKKKKIKFGYRISGLAKYIVLGAVLKLKKENKKKIQERIKKILSQRRQAQGVLLANAGCIFKNPAGDSAGRLIELCGLKGRTIGCAEVSRKHANFILNKGNAKAVDVLKLMDLAKKEVKKKFNITLMPEVKIWK